MDKMIIKGAGTIDEICTALKTMQAVFGKNARLAEVATATRYGRLTATVNRQLEEIERGHTK
jgi:hypothetical protein